MKATFIIILLLVFFDGFAQVKKDTYPEVICYFDGVMVTSWSNINPNDISGITTICVRDSVNKISKGKAYIISKKYPYQFMTIGELTNLAIPAYNNTKPVIYFVDDKLITDTAGIKFGYGLGVDVIDGSQIKAFKGLLSHVTVLKINKNIGGGQIYIKGKSST